MKIVKVSVIFPVVLAAVATTGVSSACGTYSVSPPESTDAGTEYKLQCDGFHFGTLFVRSPELPQHPVETLVFRPHPDKHDVNGWGTTWFMAPFLAGADPTSGSVDSITADADGIQVSLSGFVARSGDAYGIWTIEGTFTYNSFLQKVAARGDLVVDLRGTLTAACAPDQKCDLNLERLSSNYLENVPLQSGGSGDTGDIKKAIVTYGEQDPHNFVWIPPSQPVHFPIDTSTSLEIEVVGQINDVDTKALGEDFQIAVARKPTLSLAFSSEAGPLSAGLSWDADQGQNFAADNVGINHQVLKENSNATHLTFNFAMISTISAKTHWDFNGDGQADILWRNSATGENWLYRMDGADILYSHSVNQVEDLNWKIAGLGDFDGVGRADILWRNSATGENWLYLMQGNNILNSQPINTVADLNWKIAGVGDFDGDGKSDILWRNAATGETWLYLMDGNDIQASVGINTVADLNWEIAAVGDFDGDGRADILWRNSAAGQNWLYQMNGAGIQGSNPINTVADLNWKIVGVGDFDGDGKADILWRNAATGENWLYLMDGPDILESAPVNTVADLNWKIAGVADFDGDGKSDILWRNFATGENWLYRMDGASILDSQPVNLVADLNWQIQGGGGN